uniref:Uncharacterized protein n=2 Tax=Lactuca sativa TaxID=4236 RepID=A0A9R1WFF2_LACSA|nr:hypothetical protein LSAT_V11C200059680 [Lactuca sativa]
MGVNYIEGWKKSHYKEGRGWCNMQAQQDWVKIENEYKKMLDEVGGDESKVKQLECLARVLGERRGHTRSVGRKVKNIAPYNIPAPSTNNVDLNAFALQLTQQLSQQFNQQMQQMFMSQNPNTQPPPPVQFNIDLSQVQLPNRQVIYNDDAQSDDAQSDDDQSTDSQTSSGSD